MAQNNKVSTGYISFCQNNTVAIMAHLYQFISINGANDYFTDYDVDVVYGGTRWKSNSLRIDGLKRKIGVGLQVDDQTIKIFAQPSDTLWGADFLAGCQEGLLDGAMIVRYRVVWQISTGNATYDINATPVAVFPMFTGYMSKIEKAGTTCVQLHVKSPLVKLEVNMPRNYYQPGCLWTLFDSGCTLNKASYAVNGAIASGSNNLNLVISGGISPVNGADGIPYFAQGRLIFTSGVNNGLLVLIGDNNSVSFGLAYPLDEVPAIGDTVTYYPGCSKSYNTCNLKFNNTGNFRGFDKVPPIFVSI